MKSPDTVATSRVSVPSYWLGCALLLFWVLFFGFMMVKDWWDRRRRRNQRIEFLQTYMETKKLDIAVSINSQWWYFLNGEQNKTPEDFRRPNIL